MDYAVAHNSQLQHLQNEQQRRSISAQASKDARLPRLEGDMGAYMGTLHHAGDSRPLWGSSGSSDTRFDASQALFSMGLTATVPIYTGSRLSSQIKADSYALQAAVEDVRSAERNLRMQVAASWLQVLYNKGEANIARERLEVSQQLLEQARSLFDRGKRPESDVAEAAAMVSRDEALLTAADGDIALALLELRQLMNLPDDIDFDTAEPVDDDDDAPIVAPADVYSQTVLHHPAVRSSNFSILQAEQGVRAARAGYRPTLSLVGQLGTLWADFDAKASQKGYVPLLAPWGMLGNLSYSLSGDVDWNRKNFVHGVIGLKLSIPVFNAFETKARIRTAKVNLADAELAYADARQRIQKDIRQAWQGAVTARKRYEAETKAEEAGALAYRYALKRYEAGMATLYDLSQSRQQWFAATERVLSTKYEYLIRKRILDILAPTE